MTQVEYETLRHADANFKRIAESYGLKCEGPSVRGSFLVDDGTSVRCFGPLRPGPHKSLIRIDTPSVWTPLNVSMMRQNTYDKIGNAEFDTLPEGWEHL